MVEFIQLCEEWWQKLVKEVDQKQLKEAGEQSYIWSCSWKHPEIIKILGRLALY